MPIFINPRLIQSFLIRAIFKGKIRLQNATFRHGVDFRTSDFNLVSQIDLENCYFPEGRLYIYWDQIKMRDDFRITVDTLVGETREDHYNRLSIIYNRLKENFLVQGDKSSADAVMYELGYRRDTISTEILWKCYGWFFGYGYQPWRFLLYIVFPGIFVFASLWYYHYFEALQNVIFKENIEAAKVIQTEVSEFDKIWYSVLFSFSVLLSIRFRREWVVHYRQFLYWVTFEWILGIGLYIIFALLIRSSRFDYIKGFLGF